MRLLRLAIASAALAAAASVSAVEVSLVALFKDKAVVRIDGSQHTLAVGQKGPQGVRLVAADSEAAVVEFDGRRERLELGAQIGSAFAPTRPPPQVRVFAGEGGMYRVNGTVNGQFMTFLVDTGANLVTLNATQARRLRIDLAKGRPARAETASGVVDAYAVTLDALTIGDITLREVAAMVMEGPFPSVALLGLSAIDRMDMSREGGALVLKARR